MARYEWPDEFAAALYSLEERLEALLRAQIGTAGSDLTGDQEVLDEVIANNFEEARTWLPLGPSILRKGQASGAPLVSGRVRSIAVNSTGQRAYIAAANGGVWYTDDAGQTWASLGAGGLSPTTDRTDLSLTNGDLCVVFGKTGSADDPAKDVVYVGTGEANPRLSQIPGANSGGIGVLRLNGTVAAAVAAPRANPWVREARNLSGAGIYRLVHGPTNATKPQPNGQGTFYAATSNGLYTRSGGFTEDSNWTEVTVGSNAISTVNTGFCSDVVWTTSGLWVAVAGMTANADNGLFFAPSSNLGNFTKIAGLPFKWIQRISLGEVPGQPDRIYVLSKVAPPGGTGNDHAKLWSVDKSATPATVKEVRNFPVGLFVGKVKEQGGNFVTEGNDQGNYDQAIAVRRSGTNDVVLVGGSIKWADDWDASIFELTINPAANPLQCNFDADNQTDPADDATFQGRGIHADVHCLKYQGSKFWVGCDGGVFMRDGASVSSLNAGLATVEPGYVASHPRLDGPVIAGTQDNGSIRRIGDTVWELFKKGDGGGCFYHPTRPEQVVTQYTAGTWNFLPNSFWGSSPISRWNVTPGSTEEESGKAAFYSQPAVAEGDNAERARLFIGTNRIWYTDTWQDQVGGPDWVTIPSGSDPLPWPRSDLTQDALVTSTGAADKVICIEVIQNGASDAPHIGQAILVLCTNSLRIFRFDRPSPGADPAWTPLSSSFRNVPSSCAMCWPDSQTDIAPDGSFNSFPPPNGAKLTDIALHDSSTSGQESFYLSTTGLNTLQADGSMQPSANFDTLFWYDGQGKWWKTGLATAPLNTVNNTGGSASAVYSVIVHPTDKSIVYVGNQIGVWEGRLSIQQVSGVDTPSWTWKPAMEGLPQAQVQDLSLYTHQSSTYLRAALVARGVWERDISDAPDSVGQTFIRTVPFDMGRQALFETLTDPHTQSSLTHHHSPDIALLTAGSAPWGARSPNEAELMTAAEAMPSSLPRSNHDVFVMVHHRHTAPIAKGDVNIDVFLEKNAPSGTIDAYAITDDIRNFIIQTVAGNAPAAPGTLSHLQRIRPDFDVDARNPRAGKMSLNLNYAGGGSHGMLIVVVTTPGDTLHPGPLQASNLRGVTMVGHQIAVRKFRRD